MGLFSLLCSTVHSEDFQEHPTQDSDQLHGIFFPPGSNMSYHECRTLREEERSEHPLKRVKAMETENIRKARSFCL